MPTLCSRKGHYISISVLQECWLPHFFFPNIIWRMERCLNGKSCCPASMKMSSYPKDPHKMPDMMVYSCGHKAPLGCYLNSKYVQISQFQVQLEILPQKLRPGLCNTGLA